MPLFAQLTHRFQPDFASAEHRAGRLATIARQALPAVTIGLTALSVWGMARMSAAEEAVRPSPPATDAKADQAETSAAVNSSRGAFGQFLSTIDDFYNQETPPEAEKPQPAKQASETGTTDDHAAEDKSVKTETEALVRDALPHTGPEETKMVRVGRSSGRASLPRASQTPLTKAEPSEQLNVPRWARGGLLGSFFGDKEAQEDHAAEQMTQSPTPHVAEPTTPPAAKQLSQTAEPGSNQEAPREAGTLARSAGAAKRWMGKMVDPLFGSDEPADRQASASPARLQAKATTADRQASLPPATHQASTSPAARPTRHMPLAYPQMNQPLAHTRPGTSRPAQRRPSMDPTVAVQFGQKYSPPAPSQPAQAQSQLAQLAPPSASQGVPSAKSQGQAVTPPSATAGDVTPIAGDDLATAAPEKVLPVSPVDLADVLPAVEAAASRRVAVVPDSERTPTLAEEYAQSDIQPAGPPASWNGYGTPPQGVATVKPPEFDGVAFESSINVLGLAELTGQAGKVNSIKPSTEGTPARRSPVVEVARQPRMVR
jgi:hypothetical protein